MTACLFGTYDASHSANRLLRAALAQAGFAVEDMHEPLWERTRTKARRYFAAPSLARLGVRYLAAATRLARRWPQRRDPAPLVVVGFGGQLDVLLAWRVCRPRSALVFVPLVSLSETLVDDRRVFAPGRPAARAVGVLDRATLTAPDLVLADTNAHAAYLRALGGPKVRAGVWHFGVEPEFLTVPPCSPEPGRVLFYGRYLPLHGLDAVVDAAARLGARARFVLIGDGPERPRIEALARRRSAPITWQDEIPLATLPAELGRAAVVLGVFGDGPKAAMVVPNKVYQAAAAGRPLVTRDGPGLREVLEPGTHCLAVPAGDGAALADAVGTLLDDPARAQRLGDAARAHVLSRFGPDAVAASLAKALTVLPGLAPQERSRP
jgi:glycosyltransferase involved in cell wall biosynthesis